MRRWLRKINNKSPRFSLLSVQTHIFNNCEKMMIKLFGKNVPIYKADSTKYIDKKLHKSLNLYSNGHCICYSFIHFMLKKFVSQLYLYHLKAARFRVSHNSRKIRTFPFNKDMCPSVCCIMLRRHIMYGKHVNMLLFNPTSDFT